MRWERGSLKSKGLEPGVQGQMGMEWEREGNMVGCGYAESRRVWHTKQDGPSLTVPVHAPPPPTHTHTHGVGSRRRVTRPPPRTRWTTLRPFWARSPCSASAWGTRCVCVCGRVPVFLLWGTRRGDRGRTGSRGVREWIRMVGVMGKGLRGRAGGRARDKGNDMFPPRCRNHVARMGASWEWVDAQPCRQSKQAHSQGSRGQGHTGQGPQQASKLSGQSRCIVHSLAPHRFWARRLAARPSSSSSGTTAATTPSATCPLVSLRATHPAPRVLLSHRFSQPAMRPFCML